MAAPRWTPGPSARSRLVLVLDWLLIVLPLLALAIDLTGGFYLKIGGVRISSQRTDRVVFLALGALALRMWIGEGIKPLGGRVEWLRPLRDRLSDPNSDTRPAVVDAATARRYLVFAILGFLAIGGVLLRTQLAHMDSVPDLGDPLFSMWRVGWVAHQIAGDPRPLFDGNMFYPEPLTLTYSDSMLLPAVTGAPLLAAGLHPVLAYNILFLSGFFLSALTAYLLISRITGSAQAGFIGGLMYGFYPYRFEHYSHLELQMTYWMPLGLLTLHKFAEKLQLRYAIGAALCGAAQLYSSMYYGVFFPLYAAAIVGVLLLAARTPWYRPILPIAAALAVGVALALPLARPYYAAQPVKGDRDQHTVKFYSANLSDYFRAHPRSALYGGRLLPDEHPERALFPGVTPLAYSVVALLPPVGVMRLAYLAGLVTAFDLSRGFNGNTYEYLYNSFEGIRGMRVPARISVILAISLAMLGGFGARRLLARIRNERVRAAAFLALVAAVAIDLHPALSLKPVWLDPPPIYDGIASDQRAVLAEFPFATRVPDVIDNIQYLYFSLWHWRALANGYSGFSSEEYRAFQKQMADFPGPGTIEALRRRGVTHVSVNCAFYLEGCEQLLDSLETRPEFQELVSGRWHGSVVRLYRIK
jgi:hypothetical protein